MTQGVAIVALLCAALAALALLIRWLERRERQRERAARRHQAQLDDEFRLQVTDNPAKRARIEARMRAREREK